MLSERKPKIPTSLIWWSLVISYITYICFDSLYINVITVIGLEIPLFFVWMGTILSLPPNPYTELVYRIIISLVSAIIPLIVNWVFDIRALRGMTWLLFLITIVCYTMIRVASDIVGWERLVLTMGPLWCLLILLPASVIVSGETATIIASIIFVLTITFFIYAYGCSASNAWRLFITSVFFVSSLFYCLIYYFMTNAKRRDFQDIL